MGACDDWVRFDGDSSPDVLEKKFKDHQSMLAEESGHSYSGRLNMCNGLKIFYSTFNSKNEAQDFIRTKWEKWGPAIAVRYLQSAERKDDAQMNKLKEKSKILTDMLWNLKRQINQNVKNKLKTVEFIKCGNCRSKLDTRFSQHTLNCPVCGGSFATKSELNKEKSFELRIQDLQEKIQQRAKVLQEKADKKCKSRKKIWLIGGLCSS